jgi:hypothetical protein
LRRSLDGRALQLDVPLKSNRPFWQPVCAFNPIDSGESCIWARNIAPHGRDFFTFVT